MMQRTPLSTYRLQLHAGFTFDQAASIADYIRELGVSHVYSSPYLQAGKGSMHGYDVVDHHKVNAELGGEAAHGRFSRRLGELGLGQVLDIVPNHMSVDRQNRMWWDVLENGPSSRFATFFDIDWNSSEEKLRDKVLMPRAWRSVWPRAVAGSHQTQARRHRLPGGVWRTGVSASAHIACNAVDACRGDDAIGHAELPCRVVCASARDRFN